MNSLTQSFAGQDPEQSTSTTHPHNLSYPSSGISRCLFELPSSRLLRSFIRKKVVLHSQPIIAT